MTSCRPLVGTALTIHSNKSKRSPAAVQRGDGLSCPCRAHDCLGFREIAEDRVAAPVAEADRADSLADADETPTQLPRRPRIPIAVADVDHVGQLARAFRGTVQADL